MAKITHLLLAAGSSSRMKRAKQLLPWGTQTLVEYQIDKLLRTSRSILVVLGANADEIEQKIKHLPIKICINKAWKEGMGTSIAYGCKTALKVFPDTNGLLISLVDQPLLTLSHYQNMIASFDIDGKRIIASRSTKGWTGVPALFTAHYFNSLQQLQGKEGAKNIIRMADSVNFIIADKGLSDMDTDKTYQQLHFDYFGKEPL